ncbi:MAG: ABC transporter ATP-binding protein [Bacilli bacterium]|nr:ABC transporter ATP-binding protein [Bacilli bacterium]
MNKLLEIKNLKKRYHDKNGETLAIENINLDIYENEFISIVGSSGCGKSTLLSILANLEDKSEGTIKYKKENIRIGYMLQKDSLLPWRTILDNCLLGLEIKNELTKEKKEKVISLLDKYGLKDFIYKYPSSLSGGMRQRVALIRTLAIEPDILLLDEPLSSLDYQTRIALSDDLYKIIKDQGKTAIMVTHDLGEVEF